MGMVVIAATNEFGTDRAGKGKNITIPARPFLRPTLEEQNEKVRKQIDKAKVKVVTGKLSKPVITGRARVVEGVIMYLKTEFEIEKGIVDFVDPYSIEPDIDLAAKSRIRDWVSETSSP